MRCNTKHISMDATIKDTGATPAEILHISGDLSFRKDEFKMELLQHLCTSWDCNDAWGLWYHKTADAIATFHFWNISFTPRRAIRWMESLAYRRSLKWAWLFQSSKMKRARQHRHQRGRTTEAKANVDTNQDKLVINIFRLEIRKRFVTMRELRSETLRKRS